MATLLQYLVENLIRAVEEGNLAKVQKLVELHGKKIINGSGRNERCTALHIASLNGNLEVVKYLLGQGADVNSLDYGQTPLFYAVTGGQLLVVQYLCEQGNAQIVPEGKFNPVSNACLLNDVDCLRYLVEAQGAHVRFEDFLLAVRDGHLEVVRYLCGSRDSHRFEADSQEGANALGRACANDHVHIARYLINQGADLNARNEEHDYLSPLALASRCGHLAAVEFLCSQGADLHTKYSTGTTFGKEVEGTEMTALELASGHGRTSIVKHLHGQGAVATSKALHLAAMHNHFEIVVYLSEEAGIDLGARDLASGQTALHMAATAGYTRLVEYLCGKDAIDNNARTATGETALYLAAAHGRASVVGCLCTQEGIEIDAPTATGSTALHEATKSGSLFLHLLNMGANPNAQDQDGNSPLHLAVQRVRSTQFVLVKALLDEGANPLLANAEGETPVSLAVAQPTDTGKDSLNLIFVLMQAGGFSGLVGEG